MTQQSRTEIMTLTNAIKSSKFNSKKFFKNKKNAFNFLNSFYISRYDTFLTNETAFNKIYTIINYTGIYGLYESFKSDYRLKKSCKAGDLYNFIDKYIGEIVVRDIYDRIGIGIKNTGEYFDRFDKEGFIRYSMIYHKTINTKINNMFSRFLERLYNPRTELGRNYALKNIEWAF
tara:strand:- start:92 stop:616 length:525 start_codon:yes stop_codon:yes gene_type:complete